jgi:hypothetical protein
MRRALTTRFFIAAAIVMMPAAAHADACLGIVLPASTGIKGDALKVETAARELLTSNLSDPSLKVIPLELRLRTPAIEEARKQGCGRVLTMSLTQKTGGGGVKSLTGKIAEGAGTWSALSIPGTGLAGAAARGAAVAGAAAVASLAASTRVHDELRIDYEIIGVDGSSVGAQSERLKASADGEDLLTPLMRRVAERVHSTMTSR